MKHIAITCLLAMAAAWPINAVAATPDWMHIYHYPENDVRSVTSVPLDQSPKVTYSGDTSGDLFTEMTVTTSDGASTSLLLEEVERVELSTNVPVISIVTDDPTFEEVKDKTTYIEGTLTITAYGDEASMGSGPMRVRFRGRGNSTMLFEKKPYRLNFANNPDKASQKPSLLGMTKAKNYVLIANVQDPTLMWNGTAFRMADAMGMEFVNSSVPVWVKINGVDRGAYMLSEKIGINAASVNIDETDGRLLELSTDYDEDYKWQSTRYGLPVMVKDPDLAEVAADTGTTAEALMSSLQSRFAAIEDAVAAGHPERELDMDALTDYMLVQLVSGNLEVNHPKSVFMYSRGEGEKWMLGPVWDYDWAFSFAFSPDYPLLALRYADTEQTTLKSGNNFFMTIVDSEPFREAFATKWARFKEEVYPNLLEWIDEYAARVRVSAFQDGDLWRGRMTDEDHYVGSPNDPGKFDSALKRFKEWLDKRVAFIDSHPNYGFHDD